MRRSPATGLVAGERESDAAGVSSRVLVGSVLFAADRRFQIEHTPDSASGSTDVTRAAIDSMVDLSVRDEEQFIRGIRKLVASLTAAE